MSQNLRLKNTVDVMIQAGKGKYQRKLIENSLWELFTERGVDCKVLWNLIKKASTENDRLAVLEDEGERQKLSQEIGFANDILRALKTAGELVSIDKKGTAFCVFQKLSDGSYSSCLHIFDSSNPPEEQFCFTEETMARAFREVIRADQLFGRGKMVVRLREVVDGIVDIKNLR